MAKYINEFGDEYEDISEYFLEKTDGDEHCSGLVEIAQETADNTRKVVSNLVSLLIDKGLLKADEETVEKLLKGVW